LPAPGAELSLLDVGCGTGRSQAVYRERTACYAGIDLSLAALALARRGDPRSSWLQADACRLPFGGGSFHVVAFSSVLHHLSLPHLALAEARRVLRPGGWVFAFDPNLLHPAMALFRHPKSPFYRSEGVSPDEHPLRPATLRAWFRAAGFVELGQRCQSDLPYRQVAPRGLDALLPLYNRLDWLWEKVGLGRWLGSFVVTWGRKE
jgi:ubiquinone/menaquinone biosynthesis C-methylase UbiE